MCLCFPPSGPALQKKAGSPGFAAPDGCHHGGHRHGFHFAETRLKLSFEVLTQRVVIDTFRADATRDFLVCGAQRGKI